LSEIKTEKKKQVWQSSFGKGMHSTVQGVTESSRCTV